MDTGFDGMFSAFENNAGTAKKFLYRADPEAGEGFSGWNFVDNTHNTYDDNPGRHGTAILAIMEEITNDLNVPHQFLPVKIARANGVANYFEILCGFYFSLRKADVINTSLGWTDHKNDVNTIFTSLLEDFPDKIIVASAGNYSDDNDELPHFPSSYYHPNIISVAATNKFTKNPDALDAAYFTNFGTLSVDVFAPGEHVIFYDRDGITPVGLDGTSFAAPQVAAKVAQILYNHGMDINIVALRNQLVSSGIPVTFEKKTKYDVFLNPGNY